MELMSVGVPASTWGSLPAILGVLGLVIGFFILVLGEGRERWVGVAVMAIAAAALWGSAQIGMRVDIPRDQARIEAAYERLQPHQDRLAETTFLLKETAQKDLLHGDIKGEFGGFIFIVGAAGGSVCGQIDEAQQLTLVYYDSDRLIDTKFGVWRVMTIPLEDVEIVTILADEKPYLKYDSEIRTIGTGTRQRVALFVAETPTLYLPEGWELIGASENYGSNWR